MESRMEVLMRFRIVCSFLMVVSLATGCGRLDRWLAGTTGRPTETCFDGVTYLQFTSGASVKYTQDGKVATCR